jgi:hypothetical protein
LRSRRPAPTSGAATPVEPPRRQKDGRTSLRHAKNEDGGEALSDEARLPKVATEMALHVLAYNLTRVMNIMGIQPLMAATRA